MRSKGGRRGTNYETFQVIEARVEVAGTGVVARGSEKGRGTDRHV